VYRTVVRHISSVKFQILCLMRFSIRNYYKFLSFQQVCDASQDVQFGKSEVSSVPHVLRFSTCSSIISLQWRTEGGRGSESPGVALPKGAALPEKC